MKQPTIHHFNEKGFSVMTEEYLLSQIANLEKENEILRRQLTHAAHRLRENYGKSKIAN